MPRPLASFPAGRADHLQVPAVLAEQGIGLRPATPGDLSFLRRLYGQTREAELAAVAWPLAVRERFMDDQFALQHAHYLSQYAGAEFLVVERAKTALGRLYLWRDARDFLIVEISLHPSLRGQGVGSALIGQVQQAAVAADAGVQLHVDRHNVGALRLYRRLGFVEQAIEGASLRMCWPALP